MSVVENAFLEISLVCIVITAINIAYIGKIRIATNININAAFIFIRSI